MANVPRRGYDDYRSRNKAPPITPLFFLCPRRLSALGLLIGRKRQRCHAGSGNGTPAEVLPQRNATASQSLMPIEGFCVGKTKTSYTHAFIIIEHL